MSRSRLLKKIADNLVCLNSNRAFYLKTLVKRLIVALFCRGWISMDRCQRIYDQLDLKDF